MYLKKIELKKEVEGAVDESTENKSQKPLEEHASGVSGRPTKYDYDGMRTREKKNRDRDLAD